MEMNNTGVRPHSAGAAVRSPCHTDMLGAARELQRLWVAFECVRVLVFLLFCLMVTGCRSEILKVRSLGPPADGDNAAASGPHIAGLERSSTGTNGKIQANVLVVHGMGWSQEPGQDVEFGFDIVKAIESAYGVSGMSPRITPLCPQWQDGKTASRGNRSGGVRIHGKFAALTTDAPGTRVNGERLACLDRIEIDLGPKGRVNVYRLFWDDPFYDGYEYAHIGYDDKLFYGLEKPGANYPGYENLAALRESWNGRLKTNLVSYGFGDAIMYISPVGARMRAAVREGICHVVNEITGQTHDFDALASRQAGDWESKELFFDVPAPSQLCKTTREATPAPLVIVTKSLGSRIVFDVLTRERDADLARKLDLIANKQLEVFLFANQIPLLGIGRLRESHVEPAELKAELKFIAVSEVNDVFTYELVPYFEHLYHLRSARLECVAYESPSRCMVRHQKNRVKDLGEDAAIRRAYVAELGFDVIDVRVRFAGRPIPFFPFVHPEAAHNEHMKAKQVRQIFLCGADAGVLRMSGCASR
jgi:hypothetical protein